MNFSNMNIDKALQGIRPDNHPEAYKILMSLKSANLHPGRAINGEAMKPELKPCPFCNSTDISLRSGLHIAHVECGCCGAQGPTVIIQAGQPARSAWNRRALVEAAKVPSDDFARVLKLALEYFADRQQRYKNRAPVWVQEARALLEKYGTKK